MKVVTIGRSSECDVVINDPYVGRTHLQLVVDNGKYYCVDLNSKNGTFVNGRQITGKVQLNENDIIRIGNTTLPWQQYIGEPNTNKSKKSFWITMIALGVVLLACVGLGIYSSYNSEPKTEDAIINSLKEFDRSRMPASFKNLWSEHVDKNFVYNVWNDIKQAGNRYGIDWTSLEYYDSYHKTKKIDNETFTYGALLMSLNSSMDYESYLVWYIVDSSGKIVMLHDNWSRELKPINDRAIDSLNDMVDKFENNKNSSGLKKSHSKITIAKPTLEYIQYDLIGHKLSEGVSDGYHKQDWTYEIKNNSISSIYIKKTLEDNGNNYVVVASCHLEGGANSNFYYDTELKIGYINNGSGWKLNYVNSLGMNVVSDGQYNDCILYSLVDDGWGGVNCLNIRNTSECSLVVAGKIRTYNEWKKFSTIVSPHKSASVGGTFGGGNVKDYIIDFVVREQ